MKEYIESICVSPLEFLFNAALILMWAAFMLRTLTPRFQKKWIIIVYVVICFVVMPMSTALPSRSVLHMFGVPMLMVVTAFICFKGRPFKILFCSFFPEIAILLAESLILFVYPEIYLNYYDANDFWLNSRTFLLWFTYLPFYVLVLWFTASQIRKTKYSLTVKQWAIFSFFPLSQAATVYFVYNSMFGLNASPKQLVIFGGFLTLCIAADIALVRTIADAGRKAELEATNRMLEKQLNMQLSHYEALTSQYEANRRIRHDIMHHVNTIQYLLADGKQQEAAEYAGQFLKENRRSSMLGSCENPVVDAFLFGRVEEAKKQGIPVKTNVVLPVELPVSNTDLVIVFGNIMDNAVEACGKIESPSIELDAHIDGSYLIISESNPALPEPEDTKKRRIPELERGVGTQILDSVAKKHDGSCVIETKDGKFTVSVILWLYKS